MLFLATARRRSFIFTPSDFLLLASPLAILLLPQEWQAQYKLDLISLRSLVIFMTIRMLYRRRPKHIGNRKPVGAVEVESFDRPSTIIYSASGQLRLAMDSVYPIKFFHCCSKLSLLKPSRTTSFRNA
jgi:hypothetical protein